MGKMLSRRQVIIGATSASLAAVIPSAFAESSASKESKATAVATLKTGGLVKIPFRRYMASIAVLGDGRLLMTGGFSSKPTPNSPLKPNNSAWIFEPNSGEWIQVASMQVARARHASVQLNDGRVAVLGGYHYSPTNSIEIYDTATDTWTAANPLAHPRYDHTAISDGRNVYVIGGSCDAMLGTMEIIPIRPARSYAP